MANEGDNNKTPAEQPKKENEGTGATATPKPDRTEKDKGQERQK